MAMHHGARSSVKLAIAAGLGLGLMLPTLRKVLAQGVTSAAGPWDQILTAEHKVVIALIDTALKTRQDQPARRKMLLAKIEWGLSKHAYAEETVIYPALRRLGPPSDEKALYDDHADIKILLAALRDTPGGEPAWAEQLQDLKQVLETHMAEEESTVFPKLRDVLPEAENARLTVLLNAQELRLA